MSGRLEGKVALITGAGSGVGRAASQIFAREGAKVVCTDVQEDWVKETVRLVEAEGGTAVAVKCDVTVESEVQAAIAAAVESYDRLDVIYNNAGIASPPGMPSFEDYDDAMWNRVMDINLRGIFYGMKHAIRQFKSQGDGGVIVNTGSVAGMVGWGGTVYGTSKGGVNQMTRAVAIECAPFGIRVNAVCPAGMPTNFGVNDSAAAFQEKAPEHLEMLGKNHPLGK